MMLFKRTFGFAYLPSLILLACLGSAVNAAVPVEPADIAKVVGKPAKLLVQPGELILTGSRSPRQVIVSGVYSDGSMRDLTQFCDWEASSNELMTSIGVGSWKGKANGMGNLRIRTGGVEATIPVAVRAVEQAEPVGFRHEMIAALNVGGCNQGACHGTPSGKNGFRLSLRGYDPAADHLQLTRDVLGRRADRQDPDASLILLKALGRIPHEGGQRFPSSSVAANILRQWIAEGLRDDSANLPGLKRIEVLPGPRVLQEPARWQQLAVIAHFADGRSKDVTRLTNFSTSDSAVADISSTGLVEFQQAGEAAILCRYLEEMMSVRLTYLQPKKGLHWSQPREANYVDQLVFRKLRMLSIPPSELCSDQEFLRRVFLDVCGILPNAEESRMFLNDQSPAKRERLIESLVARPEYADFWTLKWSDVLRSNRKAIQEKGTHVYQDWLRTHISRNTPFDQIVKALLTANGSTFANPPANYYRIARDPQSLAESTAQLFFGIRMQCAKCHNHPFERWTQDDYYSLAAFFARVRQKKDVSEPGVGPMAQGAAEMVYSDRTGEVVQPRTGQVMPPKFIGGQAAAIQPGKDRREAFADWLTEASNPFFAKSVVNRIWFHVMGRGIVDPVDDFRDSNPSANDELLQALADDFVGRRFDVKQLLRTILLSSTYQLSSRTNEFNKDDNKYFSHALPKLLTAEQLLDGISTATDVAEKYPGLPLGTRAMQLPDGEVNNTFLKTFGQPARELACECEREGDSNLAQALQLINGPTINDKIRNPANRLGKLLGKKAGDQEILGEMYLATLSRPPLPTEVATALAHVAKAADKRKAWEDVQWALINSKEFLFRH